MDYFVPRHAASRWPSQPQTWRRVNEDALGRRVCRGGRWWRVPNAIRADTTVVESNIHYPADITSCCGTLWRVGVAAVDAGSAVSLAESCPHRFHTTARSSGCGLYCHRVIMSSPWRASPADR